MKRGGQYKPALYALIRLHADIGGRQKTAQHEADKLSVDLMHVEAVLKLIQPGFDVRLIAHRRRYNTNQFFERGDCIRVALDVLRTADRPLTTREIAVRMLEGKGVYTPPAKLRRDTSQAIHRSLVSHDGTTVKSDGGKPVRWTVHFEKI